MKYILEDTVLNEILQYLGARPYGEVAKLVQYIQLAIPEEEKKVVKEDKKVK